MNLIEEKRKEKNYSVDNQKICKVAKKVENLN
jgi:hypothetical protein